MRIFVRERRHALAALDPGAVVERWVVDAVRTPDADGLVSIVRTARELSVLAPADAVPEGLPGRRDLRILEVEGPLPLHLVGILARIARVLADAQVPVLAVSSHDTDFIAVPQDDLARAIAALRADGIDVEPM